MGEINFAVWNIDRAAAKPDDREFPDNKIQEPAANLRIGRLLEKTDPDFIFLQEIPDPNRIGILSPSGNEWKIPARDSELESAGCKCLYKDDFLQGVWIPHPDQEHHCCGVLFCQTEHGRKRNLAFRKVKSITNNPVGLVCTIFHTGKPEDDILRFIGFWNVPEKYSSRPDIPEDIPKTKYLPPLLNFLDGLDKNTCSDHILAGDTNVNVRTDNENPGVLTKPGEFLENYLEQTQIGLTLIHGGADRCSLRSKTQKDPLTGKPKWYRCDLLMASNPERISHVSFGDGADYMWKGKTSGSDHLPLFFTFSFND